MLVVEDDASYASSSWKLGERKDTTTRRMAQRHWRGAGGRLSTFWSPTSGCRRHRRMEDRRTFSRTRPRSTRDLVEIG
jgi:hypothetical protein